MQGTSRMRQRLAKHCLDICTYHIGHHKLYDFKSKPYLKHISDCIKFCIMVTLLLQMYIRPSCLQIIANPSTPHPRISPFPLPPKTQIFSPPLPLAPSVMIFLEDVYATMLNRESPVLPTKSKVILPSQVMRCPGSG